MPMQPVTVPLNEPIEGHEGKVTSITVRPATYATIMRLGEPYTTVRTKDGAIYALEDPATINAYLEAMVDEKAVALLPQLGMADTLALKKAVLDFFASARMVNSAT